VVAASSVIPFIEWKFGSDGKDAIKVKPRLTVSSNDAAIEASLLDMGISRLLSYQVDAYFKSGQLIRLLEQHEPAQLPIHVVHRESRYASTKVRTFVDLMVAHLRERLPQR
jgi:DNA-binding transcriptional LysR family regulator